MKKNLIMGGVAMATLVVTNVLSYRQGLVDGLSMDRIVRAKAFRESLKRAGLADILKEED